MHRIGVLGASFNPPTLGHQDVVNQALSTFDEILLIPSVYHAFEKQLAPIKHRLAMLQLFIQNWHNRRSTQIIILNIEQDIALKHPEKKVIYTYDVLSQLQTYYQAQNRPCELNFIIGPDNAAPEIWKKFYRHEEIEKRWPLYIAKERVAIHSTLVRDAINKYRQDPEKLKTALLKMVDSGVAEYIMRHDLYHDKRS